MAETQSLTDSDLFATLGKFYEGQQADMLYAKSYVQTHCTLSDAYGLLLSCLKGPYENCRDQGFQAFQTVSDLLDGIANQVDGVVSDLEKQEQAHIDEIQAILDRLAALEAAQAASNNGGSGSFGGGGGGGGSGMPSYTPPIPSPVDPGTGGGDTIINNYGDGDVYIENGDGDLIVGGDDPVDEGPEIETEPIPDPEVDPETGDPLALTPEEQVEYDKYMDEFWAERAAEDPLGRTADELRALWEDRDPITADPADFVGLEGAGAGAGVGAGVGGGPPENIGALLPDTPVSTGMRMTR